MILSTHLYLAILHCHSILFTYQEIFERGLPLQDTINNIAYGNVNNIHQYAFASFDNFRNPRFDLKISPILVNYPEKHEIDEYIMKYTTTECSNISSLTCARYYYFKNRETEGFGGIDKIYFNSTSNSSYLLAEPWKYGTNDYDIVHSEAQIQDILLLNRNDLLYKYKDYIYFYSTNSPCGAYRHYHKNIQLKKNSYCSVRLLSNDPNYNPIGQYKYKILSFGRFYPENWGNINEYASDKDKIRFYDKFEKFGYDIIIYQGSRYNKDFEYPNTFQLYIYHYIIENTNYLENIMPNIKQRQMQIAKQINDAFRKLGTRNPSVWNDLDAKNELYNCMNKAIISMQKKSNVKGGIYEVGPSLPDSYWISPIATHTNKNDDIIIIIGWNISTIFLLSICILTLLLIIGNILFFIHSHCEVKSYTL